MESGKNKRRSIARQLNAELEWRRFFKKLTFSILFAAAAVIVWCYIQEVTGGGRTFGVASRQFEGALHPNFPQYWGKSLAALPGDFLEAARSIAYGMEPEFSDWFPFRDVYYCFALPGNPDTAAAECRVFAGTALGMIWWIFLVFNLFALIGATVRSITGSGLIRKYLRPLDDMAALAEQLSDEQHSADRETVREETKHSEGLESALDDVIGEIDDVKDSEAKIEFHQTELEGLESALNNMLKRLEESKKKQIRFVDDASHELRTPIAVIHGYADMLDRWGKSDPKVLDEAVTAIKVESEHMTTLIDQLLFLARGEMDRHVLDRQRIDAQALLDEIMVESEMLDADHVFRMLSQPEDGEEDMQGVPEISAEHPEGEADPAAGTVFPETDAAGTLTVCADPALLKQSVRILRDNAVKYTPTGGEVTFKTYRRIRDTEDGEKLAHICIEVGDNGIGIPAEELPRIFDRFFRGSNARADNAGGSGLGLSIAQWIVREHGGTIEAISGSGFGTRMTIVLPEAEKEAA
jgi:signal transduction histidine kinase